MVLTLVLGLVLMMMINTKYKTQHYHFKLQHVSVHVNFFNFHGHQFNLIQCRNLDSAFALWKKQTGEIAWAPAALKLADAALKISMDRSFIK